MKEEKILIEFEKIGVKLGYYHHEIWHCFLFNDSIMFNKLLDRAIDSDVYLYNNGIKTRLNRRKNAEYIGYMIND